MSFPADSPDKDTELMADRLAVEAPVPGRAFRDDLSSRVRTAAVRLRIRKRPTRFWPVVLMFGLGGALLLGVATFAI